MLTIIASCLSLSQPEEGRSPYEYLAWVSAYCPGTSFIELDSTREKLPRAIYKRTGFRCCSTNSTPSHQVGTCFMWSPEVWLGKPLSQARIQGQEKKKKKASLTPVATSQQGGQPLSSLAPGLGSLEPWPPFEHSLPHSLVL